MFVLQSGDITHTSSESENSFLLNFWRFLMNILSTSGFAARLVLVLAIGVLSALPATAHASSEPV